MIESSIGNINRLTVTCSEALHDESRTFVEYFQRKFCRDSTELFFSSTVAAIKINARKTSSSRTFDPESTYTKTYRHVSRSSSVKNLVSKNATQIIWPFSVLGKDPRDLNYSIEFVWPRNTKKHCHNTARTYVRRYTRRDCNRKLESLCTTRHMQSLLRVILSIVFRNGHGHENFQRQVGELFERSHFPAGRSGTKTHDTHAMLACRELTTRDNAGRPKPTERARKWPNSPQVLRASTD